jgi:hypothetical protein
MPISAPSFMSGSSLSGRTASPTEGGGFKSLDLLTNRLVAQPRVRGRETEKSSARGRRNHLPASMSDGLSCWPSVGKGWPLVNPDPSRPTPLRPDGNDIRRYTTVKPAMGRGG